MSFGAGRLTRVYVNGYDLSAFFNNAEVAESQGFYDVTTFTSTFRAWLSGFAGGTITGAGFFDGSVGAADEILAAAAGAASDGMILVFFQGDAVGARGRGASTIETSYAITVPVDGAVGIAFGAQSDGGLDGIVSLHALGAETSASNSTSVDNAASSANGGAGYVECTAFTGTSITVKVQHSTDNSTWVDLITFTAISAAHAYQRVVVTGTVNRYTRSIWTGTFTTATFAVGFGRR